VKILIGVARKSQGCETRLLDDNSKLLLQLPDQRILWALARVDLAAGEFPEAGHRFSGRPLRDQDASVGVNERAGGDQDDLYAQDVAPDGIDAWVNDVATTLAE
jgi:hypothetical protein